MGHYEKTKLYCSNPSCTHAREPHPIHGQIWLSFIDPEEVQPEFCPLCEHTTQGYPIFLRDEEGISDETL